MNKFIIKSQQMQNGEWQPAYLSPQGPKMFSEPIEFNIYFKSKIEADNYTLQFLKNEVGIIEEQIKL